MSNVNITEVHLLNAPLESDYKITLYFANKTDQTNYFKSKTIHTFDNCSYQRKDKVFRAYKHIDGMYNCNYVMYKNSAYSDRWFYAFITNMEYVNDERTDIYIETDVMQTWMFDYTVKPSFVEREHVMDDTVGIHTVPEGLETGDYVTNGITPCQIFSQSGIVVASTLNLSKMSYDDGAKCSRVQGYLYNGVYSGVAYYYFDTDSDSLTHLSITLQCLESMGQSEGITSIFMIPKNCVELTDPVEVSVEGGTIPVVLRMVKPTDKPFTADWKKTDVYPVHKPVDVDGYKPNNNKLFCYPYSYLSMSNNAGGNVIYKYELFNGDACEFRIISAITPGFSVRLIPKLYNKVGLNHDEGMNGGKFPICNWNTDVYTNWLTQNAVNNSLSIISGVGTVAGGVVATATGGGAMAGLPMIAGGIMSIANTLGSVYTHSLVPPQAEGNLNSGDVTFANQNLTFTAYRMNIKREYAEIIDQYFSLFGYKLNLVKTPYKDHRTHFWYTKTIDVNIDGAIPQEDLQKIKSCYNTGITFWRNDGTIGNYSDTVLSENAI